MDELNQEQMTPTEDEEETGGAIEERSRPGKPVEKNRRPTRRKTGELIQQIGLNMLVVGVVALVVLLVWQRFFVEPGAAAPPVTPQPTVPSGAGGPYNPEEVAAIELSPIPTPDLSIDMGILRRTNVNTIIPSRPRDNVITYTVNTGDTLFSIASNYGLKPETLLWGNYDVLEDNPHLLKPNQILRILPTDGVYYQWKGGDTLNAVADEFKVDASAIVNYPGNDFDLAETDSNGANIEPGTWLIIPGGKRAIKDWGPPAITRDNPATARYYGAGACGTVYTGAVGTGTFIWPTTDHGVSGYGYDPGVHPAIDIAGQLGNAVYAADSGVVVYAGWSDYGYGYMIAIDHGNGWQTAYAHLSAVAVSCGQSVFQGGYIGAVGSTGNSSGPHLHFEMVYNGVKVNPLAYVQ
jgi:murein DD-endopeptidase MepM/ murein hydrolase activator NlpD